MLGVVVAEILSLAMWNFSRCSRWWASTARVNFYGLMVVVAATHVS